MQLLKLPKLPPAFEVTITEEAIARRDDLLAQAAVIQAVQTEADNLKCTEVGSAMRGLVKEADAAVEEVGLPFYNAHKKVLSKGKDFKAALLSSLDRLGRLASVFRVEQERQPLELKKHIQNKLFLVFRFSRERTTFRSICLMRMD